MGGGYEEHKRRLRVGREEYMERKQDRKHEAVRLICGAPY